MEHKVLIVDDDESMTKLLEVVLKSDYQVIISHTLTDGLEQINSKQPSAVVVDLNLDGETGDDLIQTIRRDVSEWLPVIVLSGKEKSEDRIRCFEMGVDDYLSKPFNPVELKLRLKRHVEKYTRL